MACACKVNQQIDYLHKKYGHNIPVSKKTTISFDIKEKLRAIGIWIVALPIIPLMVAYILITAIFKKKKTISVKKLMKLSKVN